MKEELPDNKVDKESIKKESEIRERRERKKVVIVCQGGTGREV